MTGSERPRSPFVLRPILLGITVLVAGIGIGWWARGLADPLHRTTAEVTPGMPGMVDADAGGRPEGGALSEEDRDDALRLWSSFALAMASRSADLESMLADLESDGRDPRESIDRAIEASSDAELATILSAVTRIDEDDLLERGDLRPFASRLVEVALDGLQAPSMEPPAESRVYFSTTTEAFDPDTTAADRFPADQGRIFATVDLGDYAGDRVMVKWQNVDTRRIHSLQSMTVLPGRPVWSYLSRDGDWDPGEYRVSIYSQDAAMQLLGRGEYTVF